MSYLADMVSENAANPAAGSVTLTGANTSNILGAITFLAAFGSSPRFTTIRIYDSAGNWEVTKSLFNGSTGLTRDTLFASSTGARITFSTAVFVDCVANAEFLIGATAGNILARINGQAMP